MLCVSQQKRASSHSTLPSVDQSRREKQTDATETKNLRLSRSLARSFFTDSLAQRDIRRYTSKVREINLNGRVKKVRGFKLGGAALSKLGGFKLRARSPNLRKYVNLSSTVELKKYVDLSP